MKKAALKAVLLCVIASLLVAAPLTKGIKGLSRALQFQKIQAEALTAQIGAHVSFFRFWNVNGTEAVNKAQTALQAENCEATVTEIDSFDLVQGYYICDGKADFETVLQTNDDSRTPGSTYRTLEVKNGKGFSVSSTLSISGNKIDAGSYTLNAAFIRDDFLGCQAGRYPDLTKKYQTGIPLEVMVTDGLGVSVGDTIWLELNALDSNAQVVLV